MRVAVVGTGIAGMASAWMLAQRHDVHVFEKDDRLGGHTNTVAVDNHAIDTGFIVLNDRNYGNLMALFNHLNINLVKSDMSFGVSLDGGDFEYSGSGLSGLLAQKRNVFRGRYWSMIRDILRFYREAPLVLTNSSANLSYETFSLRDYLLVHHYSDAFINDHLIPMSAAIWSTPDIRMMDYPICSFIKFFQNHGLLQLKNRPQWYVVKGGSASYIQKLTAGFREKIRLNKQITRLVNHGNQVVLEDREGRREKFDHVVLACHADQALAILGDAEASEKKLLGMFKYQANKAVLHSDPSLMPKRKSVWSSWNYLRRNDESESDLCLTYWMNRLQSLQGQKDYFVTLNPNPMPSEDTIIRAFLYHHPIFDRQAITAQRMLWNLQGQRRIWYCGSYFGDGFHEDALQSALVVAEAISGENRPWQIETPNDRVHLPSDWDAYRKQIAA